MAELVRSVARVLYLFAPLLVASAIAGLVQRFDLLPALRRPIDGGRALGGRRVFGDSKTWRGFVVAIVGCIACVAVQRHVIGDHAGALAVVDYRHVNVVLFGAAMGGGAMLGELPNSFVKRRLRIAPGKTTRGPLSILFYVWDQIDLLSVAWPFVWTWVEPKALLLATSFVVALAIHPTVSAIGFLVGARRSAR